MCAIYETYKLFCKKAYCINRQPCERVKWVKQEGSFKLSEWRGLAKFRHFGKILKVFGNFSRVNLVFGNICDLFWQILYAVEQILIDGNDQILKKYSRHLVTLSYNHLISSTPSRYCRIVCNKLMVPPYLHLAFKIDWIDPPSALNKNINKMSQITFFIFVKSWSCLV